MTESLKQLIDKFLKTLAEKNGTAYPFIDAYELADQFAGTHDMVLNEGVVVNYIKDWQRLNENHIDTNPPEPPSIVDYQQALTILSRMNDWLMCCDEKEGEFVERVLEYIDKHGQKPFEVGNYYQHTTGEVMHILARVDNTDNWKECFIAETGTGELKAVGTSPADAVNWSRVFRKSEKQNES